MRNYKILFFVLFFFIFTLLFAQKKTSYYFDLAENARQNKEFIKAIYNYEKALELNPIDTRILYNLGKVYNILENPKRAIVYLLQAYKKGKDNKQVIYEIIRTYFHLQNYKKSEEYIMLAKQKFQNDKDLNQIIAKHATNTNKMVFAKKKLQKNLRLFPAHYPSLALLGEIYLKEKKYKDATKVFQKIIEISPDDPVILTKIGKSFIEQIIQDYQSVLYNTQKNLSFIFENAILYFKLASNSAPTYIIPNLLLGKIYTLLEQTDSAKYYLKRVIKVQKSNIEAIYYWLWNNNWVNTDSIPYLNKHEVIDFFIEQAIMQNSIEEDHSIKKMKIAEKYYVIANRLLSNYKKQEATVEILRALQFFPNHIGANKALLRISTIENDIPSTIILNKKLYEFTKEQKYEDQLEHLLRLEKSTIVYQENIKDNFQNIKQKIPVFIVGFTPENILGKYPNLGIYLKEYTQNAIKQLGKIANYEAASLQLLERKIDNTYKTKIKNYCSANTIQAISNFFAQEIQKPYLVCGSFAERNNGKQIHITSYILNLSTGKRFGYKRILEEGSGAIRRSAIRLANSIAAVVPHYGRVIKIYSSKKILINLGTNDGIQKGTNLFIVSKNKKYRIGIQRIEKEFLYAKLIDPNSDVNEQNKVYIK